MTFHELLAYIQIDCADFRDVKGISDDSREIQKDWLFIARKGTKRQGKEYREEVLEKGAVVLQEEGNQREHVYNKEHLEEAVSILLTVYYQEPWKDLQMIGITGTNGKSSVADILRQLLQKNGQQVMNIGTGEVTYLEKTIPIENTTPSIFLLMRLFALAKTLGITTIIMEISSHAIDQKRIRGIRYDFIIYTNITQDHLDYHLSKTHYQYTKFKLRKALKTKGIIILNNDDPVLENLYSLSHHKILTCGTKQAHYSMRHLHFTAQGSIFSFHSYEFHTRLLSIANVYNIVQALMVCRCFQIPYGKLQSDVQDLMPVLGRLQVLPNQSPTIWIDYAHTFMAVKSIIDFANTVKKGNLIFIVGCGGEREKEKRHQIGEYIQENCDRGIFTSDNPRYEEPDKILLDMLPKEHSHIEIIENRWFAIKHAVKIAKNSDIIIIAGKGNEKTQSFQGREYPFHDEDCVYEILQREELS